MTEHTPPDADRPEPGRKEAAGVRPGVPRWVKTLAIVLAVLLLLALLVMLVSGGKHGPGRHRAAIPGAAGAGAANVLLVIGTR
jgi:hypothetical protein